MISPSIFCCKILIFYNSDEKKYIAERLSKSQQNIILKYLQELPDEDFRILFANKNMIEIQLSRKASIYPGEDFAQRKPTWLAPLQEAQKSILEENKEIVPDFFASENVFFNVR